MFRMSQGAIWGRESVDTLNFAEGCEPCSRNRDVSDRVIHLPTCCSPMSHCWALQCHFRRWTSNKTGSFPRCNLLIFKWTLDYFPFTRNIVHSRHLKNCYTFSPYNPGQKALKLWPNILKWKVIIQFSGPSPPPLPRSNVGIVGLLEMNQHRYCVGRFEVGVRLR